MNLTIRTERTRPDPLVRLAGECDLAAAPRLQQELSALWKTDGRLTLDVSELDFLDSSGIAVILSAMKEVREAGGELVVSGARGPVRRVLEVTGLHRVIPLEA